MIEAETDSDSDGSFVRYHTEIDLFSRIEKRLSVDLEWSAEKWIVYAKDGTKYEYDENNSATIHLPNEDCTLPIYDQVGDLEFRIPLCYQQNWEWNLSEIEDTSGNITQFVYSSQPRRIYGLRFSLDSDSLDSERFTVNIPYPQKRTLREIRYGIRHGNDSALPEVQKPLWRTTSRITFGSSTQCTDTSMDCQVGDILFDLSCPRMTGNGELRLLLESDACQHSVPSYHTDTLIDSISISVLDRSSPPDKPIYNLISRFDLEPRYSTNGNGHNQLILDRIHHSRIGQEGIEKNPTIFDYQWLDSRADALEFEVPRIWTVTNDFGGVTEIEFDSNYRCPQNLTNYTRLPYDCYPAYSYVDNGFILVNKWKVGEVTESDLFTGYERVVSYDYSTPIWHKRDESLIGPPDDDGERKDSVWDDYRGSQFVTISDGKTTTTYNFYRGMRGDGSNDENDYVTGCRPNGCEHDNIAYFGGTNYEGEIISGFSDYNWLRGKVAEKIVYPESSRLVEPPSGLELFDDMGIPRRTLFFDLNDIPYLYQKIDYETERTTGTARFVAPNRITIEMDGQTSSVEYIYRDDSGEIQYGNVQTIIEHGDSTSGDERTTHYEYVINDKSVDDNYIVDRVYRETVYDGNGINAGTLSAKTEYAYDDLDYGEQPSKGNVSKIKAYSDDQEVRETNVENDSFGRPETISEIVGGSLVNATTMGFEPFYGYVESVSNVLGHNTEQVIDPGFGVVDSQTDAMGFITNMKYDSYGALRRVILPTGQNENNADSEFATTEYEYVPADLDANEPARVSKSVSSYKDGNDDPSEDSRTVHFYDGFGRPIMEKTVGSSDKAVKVYRYNTEGQLHIVSETFADSSSDTDFATPWGRVADSLPTGELTYWEYTYDELGREEAVRFSGDDSTTSTTYDGWTQTMTDANGKSTTHTYDAFGQLVKVVDALDNETTYDYNALGLVTDIWGPPSIDASTTRSRVEMEQLRENEHIHFEYDWLGRKVEVQDPDMGDWSWDYKDHIDPDDASLSNSMVIQTDGRDRKIKFEYDPLDRLTYKCEWNGDINSGNCIDNVKLAEYTYDEHGQIGRLTTIEDQSGTLEMIYGADRGLLAAERRTIGLADGQSITFEQRYKYDEANQLTSITYPNGEEVVSYNRDASSFGLPQFMGSTSETYVGSVDWVIENGIRPGEIGTPSGIVYDYYGGEKQYRLSQIRTKLPDSGPLPHVIYQYEYNYDLVGNIISLKSYFNDSGFFDSALYQKDWVYTYDDLYRLENDSLSSVNHIYHPNGNVKSAPEQSNVAHQMTYVYDDPDNPTHDPPHAVSSVLGNDESQLYEYDYDGNGNMTTRIAYHNGANPTTYNLEFDVENRMVESSVNNSRIEFVYDHAGQRISSRTYFDSNLQGELLYPFSTYEFELSDQFDASLCDNNDCSPYLINQSATFGSFREIVTQDDIDAYEDMVQGVSSPIDQPLAVSYSMFTTSSLSTLVIGVLLLLVTVGLFTTNWLLRSKQWIGLFLGAAVLGLTLTSSGHVSAEFNAVRAAVGLERSNYFFNGRLIAIQERNITGASPVPTTLVEVHTDHLGSVRAKTPFDSLAPATPQIISYPSFMGDSPDIPNGSGLTGSDIGYTGHYHDDALDLIYMNARFYVPEIGRFASADPLIPNPANPQSLNRYSYVYNNPINNTDPSGHIPVETIWDAANVAMGVWSLGKNLWHHNWKSAAIDTGGIVLDVGGTVIPYIPGGASSAIKARRAADVLQYTDEVVEGGVEFADEIVTFYHGTTSSGAASIKSGGIDLSKGATTSDFGQGFYLSSSADDAISSAMRRGSADVEVLQFDVPLSELNTLDHLAFPNASANWQDFTRFHKTFEPSHLLHGGETYDMVSGPMVRRIRSNNEVLTWTDKSYQYSIHTDNAVGIFNRAMQP